MNIKTFKIRFQTIIKKVGNWPKVPLSLRDHPYITSAVFMQTYVVGGWVPGTTNMLNQIYGWSFLTLSDFFAFLFESVFTIDDIIFDLVLMESSFTLRFINGFTFFFTRALADQRGVAELDCFFLGLLLVFNETSFGEGLLALFFLLGLKIGGVSSVALFTVSRMYAFNSICCVR